MQLAEAGFCRPLWSERILEEVREAVLRAHTDIDADGIRRRIQAMNLAFQDAIVSGWEPLAAGLDLPDPDDRHVLAAGIAGGAQALVTFNLKDFPEAAVADTSPDPRHPDEFLLDQLDLAPAAAFQVLQDQAADMNNPPSDLAGLLNRLERVGVPNFADAVRRLTLDR